MKTNELIIKIIIYLNDHINEKININNLANLFYINKDYLMRLFKKELHLSIIDYLNKKRIINSLNDLTSNNSILYIALKNGFVSQEYYTEIFHKLIGISPMTYRKSINSSNKILLQESNSLTNIINIRKELSFIDNYLSRRNTGLKELSLKKENTFFTSSIYH